jgi:hypothetical protein
MAAIPEAKAGVVSEILPMIRLLGAVFGVAMVGALFKALENAKLAELLAAAGASLDASERTEIKGLLSGRTPQRTSSPSSLRASRKGSSAWSARRSCTPSTAPCSCVWRSR